MVADLGDCAGGWALHFPSGTHSGALCPVRRSCHGGMATRWEVILSDLRSRGHDVTASGWHRVRAGAPAAAVWCHYIGGGAAADTGEPLLGLLAGAQTPPPPSSGLEMQASGKCTSWLHARFCLFKANSDRLYTFPIFQAPSVCSVFLAAW